MALVLKDRVKETTTTTGTGTVTLAGASTGYQSFSVIGNANTTYYCIAGQGTNEWEVGIGTYTASGTTLSRDTILASSNSGSVVTFSAGTKDVFVVYPAGKSVNLDASNNATALGTVASATLTNATGLPISTGVSGLGTGVATALGVNVGTAGAFVVNGGALGTPSSGTVTNLTGTASININGTVGATTPSTGAFTTLTASSDSSFTSTGALLISKGTAAQQPGSPATGMLRYNTTSNQFEGYSGSSPAWNPVGGASISNDTSTASNLYPTFAAATSGTATTIYTSNANLLYKPSTGEFQASVPVAGNGIFVNSATVAASYTIASGNNGLSAGPVTVNSGITVTISSSAVWTVV